MSRSGTPEEPALFRDIFPYGAVARTPFDGRLDSPAPAGHPYIADSTFRDGQQAAPPYRIEAVVALFDLLHKLGGKSGLIRTSEFFLYTERDRHAVEKCLERGYAQPRVVPWIRAHERDLALVTDMGFTEACILLSVSDYHIHLKLGKDRAQYRDEVLALTDKALAAGIAPRMHLEDITRADIPYCIELTRDLAALAGQGGSSLVVRLCDTLGLGVPYPGAALPRSVPRLVRAFIENAGIPGENLEFHGHNDLHKAFVNTVTAWLFGAAGASGTLLGFGERTGNAPVEALCLEHVSLTGRDEDCDLSAVPEIVQVFEQQLGLSVPGNYPLAGSDVSTTAAGIHAHGLARHPETYAAWDAGALLNRPTRVALTDRSGLAGVAMWINERFNLEGAAMVDKSHPGVAAMQQAVVEAYGEGGRGRLTDDELVHMARVTLPELFRPLETPGPQGD